MNKREGWRLDTFEYRRDESGTKFQGIEKSKIKIQDRGKGVRKDAFFML